MSSDYIVFIHRDWSKDYLRPLSARELYKMKSHNERYERRYGKPPKVYKSEIGCVEGWSIINRIQP